MLSKTLLVSFVAALFLPALVVADNADAYAKCQDTCFGNGLSCVKKCMAGSDQNNGSSNPVANVVDEENGGFVDDANLTPAERRRLNEQREQRRGDLQPQNPNVPRTLPAVRVGGGGGRR